MAPGTALEVNAATVDPIAGGTSAVAQAEVDSAGEPAVPAEGVAPAEPAAPAEEVPAATSDPVAPAAPATAETPPETAPAAGTTITVIVENVVTPTGTVNVGVCDTGLSEEGCPHGAQVKAAAGGFVSTTFRDIPPGRYAVVGYHDANGNGEFDKFLGIPREPYALSGKAAEMLAPGFEDAALAIKEGPNTVIIRLQNLFEE